MKIANRNAAITPVSQSQRSPLVAGALTCWAALLVAGCGGGGADVLENSVTTIQSVSDHTGPSPATADVQAF